MTQDPIRDGLNWQTNLGGVADPVNMIDMWGFISISTESLIYAHTPYFNKFVQNTEDGLKNVQQAVSSVDGVSAEAHVSATVLGLTFGAGVETVKAFGDPNIVTHTYSDLPVLSNLTSVIQQIDYKTANKISGGITIGPISGLEGDAVKYQGDFFSTSAYIPTEIPGVNVGGGYATSPSGDVKTVRIGVSFGTPGIDNSYQYYTPAYGSEHGFYSSSKEN